ncbi:MAG: hypothetical protein WCC36_04290 [Gammaproteobacteria bacterium]
MPILDWLDKDEAVKTRKHICPLSSAFFVPPLFALEYARKSASLFGVRADHTAKSHAALPWGLESTGVLHRFNIPSGKGL